MVSETDKQKAAEIVSCNHRDKDYGCCMNDGVEAQIAQALTDARREQEWQPIETVPKDGTAILGYFGLTAGDEPPDMAVTRYRKGGWWSTEVQPQEFDEPTHWMPLPAPPKEMSDGK